MPDLDVPEPGQRPHLSDEVASRIRDRIMTGRLLAGTHLHLERLADDLDSLLIASQHAVRQQPHTADRHPLSKHDLPHRRATETQLFPGIALR